MGHTTSISDYELSRGDGPPPCEGVDIEGAPAEKSGKASKSKKAPEPEPEEEEATWDDYTVPELKDELDALGVEYPSNARKADLIELIEAQE